MINKIIFFGTSEFGIPILDELRCAEYNIVDIVTAPDTPAGRGYEIQKSAIKKWAEQANIKTLQPKDLKNKKFVEELSAFGADMFIMAAYGKIIPKTILDIPSHGTINVHPSLLPKYRGASPIQTAILNGEQETGVTLILADEQMDHGPIIAQGKTHIEATDTNKSLHWRLASIASEMMIKTLSKWVENRIKPIEQIHAEATYTKIILRQDGKIDWTKPAQELERAIRAYYPWPGTFTFLPNGKRLKILESELLKENFDYAPGTIFETADGQAAVTCGKEAIILKKIQKEGAEVTDGKSFTNGHRNLIGIALK